MNNPWTMRVFSTEEEHGGDSYFPEGTFGQAEGVARSNQDLKNRFTNALLRGDPLEDAEKELTRIHNKEENEELGLIWKVYTLTHHVRMAVLFRISDRHFFCCRGWNSQHKREDPLYNADWGLFERSMVCRRASYDAGNRRG